MSDRRAKLKYRSLERGGSAPHLLVRSTGDSSTAADPLAAGVQMGHEFRKKTFYKPTYCQHCTDMLWGIKGQGYQCTGEP